MGLIFYCLTSLQPERCLLAYHSIHMAFLMDLPVSSFVFADSEKCQFYGRHVMFSSTDNLIMGANKTIEWLAKIIPDSTWSTGAKYAYIPPKYQLLLLLLYYYKSTQKRCNVLTWAIWFVQKTFSRKVLQKYNAFCIMYISLPWWFEFNIHNLLET